MEMSEQVNELAKALAAAQGEMKAAEMSATNPFLKSKYADLGEIIKAAKAPMAKYGLSVAQPVSGNGEQITVTTILMHASGQWMRETVTLPLGKEAGKSLAQAAGSVITYLRRYSLASMIGMFADEDTDGNEQPAKRQPARSVGSEPPDDVPVIEHQPPAVKANGNGKAAPAVDAPARAWPEATLAEIGMKYDLVPNRARNLLNLCEMDTNSTIGAVCAWVETYRTYRDQGMTTVEAAAKANGK